MTPRRELQVAVGLCLLGSLLVLWAAGRTWLSLPTSGGLTQAVLRTGVSGNRVSGVPSAIGVLGVAGVVAVAATRGRGRVVVGVVLALGGLAVVVDAARTLQQGLLLRALRADVTTACGTATDACNAATGEVVGIVQHPVWAWLTLVGGLLLLAAGALVAVRGRRWAGLGASYEAPAARRERPAGDKDVWDALDRGDDPTA